MLKVVILLMMTLNSPTLNDRYDFCGRCFRVVVLVAALEVPEDEYEEEYGSLAAAWTVWVG